MSNTIDNAFITKWASEAHHEFQQITSNLRNAVRTVTGVGASTYKFPLLGKGEATDNKPRHADLTPMNLVHDNATATLTTSHAVEYIDDLDQIMTNLSVRSEYSRAVMGAISRKMDSRVVTALDTTSTTETAGAMTAAKIAALHKKLTKNNVPMDGKRFLIVSAGALEDMLTDDKIASNDYLSKDAYTKGFVPGVLGFNVVILSDDLLITGTASKKTCYALHQSALGLAIGKEPTFQVERVPQKDSWQVMGKMLCGTALIDTKGVVKVEIDD